MMYKNICDKYCGEEWLFPTFAIRASPMLIHTDATKLKWFYSSHIKKQLCLVYDSPL